MKKIIFCFLAAILIPFVAFAYNETGFFVIGAGNASSVSFNDVAYLGHNFLGTGNSSNFVVYDGFFEMEGNLAVPEQIKPADEEILTNRTPVFAWTNVTGGGGTVNYSLIVDNDSSFSSPEINITTNNTYYIPDFDMQFADYFWKIMANDSIHASGWSSVSNFTIILEIACSLPVASFNFSDIEPNTVVNTTLNDTPISIANSGNVKLNVSINATSLWQSLPNPSSYYQYLISSNGTGTFEHALNESWNNFSDARADSITGLNYHGDNNSARIDIQIEAPRGEGAGKKSSTIEVWCEKDE